MRGLLYSPILLAALAACSAPAPPLDAELLGCGATFDDGRCALPADGALRIFVAGAPAEWAVSVGGAPIAARIEPVDGGTLVRCVAPMPAEGDPIELWVTGPRGQARFALVAPEPPVEGDRAALEAELVQASTARRGLIASRLGRLALRAGETERMAAYFAAAEASHRAVGRRSAILRDLEAGIFAATYVEPRYELARAWVERHAGLAQDRRSRGLGAYSAGLLAWQTGDPAGAAAGFDRARRLLQPLGDLRELVVAAEMEAVVLRALGRGKAALDRLAALADTLPPDAACDRARLLLNTGWLQTLERDRRGVGPDPRPALRAAHAAFADGPCAAEGPRRNAALNLALAALDADAPETARRWLDTLPADGGDTLARWRLDIEGRLALRSGDRATARARFERLARLAADVAPEAAWRAAVGLGDTLFADGETAGALAAWDRAEALLDAESLRLPLDRDRARFVVDRDRSARRLVGALVASGRPAEALCRARLARGRALAGAALRDRVVGLDDEARRRWDAALARWRAARRRLEAAAASDWTLDDTALAAARQARAAEGQAVRRALAEALAVLERAGRRPGCADLRAPAAGEVILAWSPSELPATGDGAAVERLVGFAWSADGIRAAPLPRIDGTDPARSTAALLAPFVAEITAHQRLRLIVGGGLERLDLHGAPWPDPTTGGEGPLWAARDVVWALDLPRPAQTRPPTTRRAEALVVADPGRDLPAAQAEASAAERALRASGWAVTALRGEAATGDAVRGRLGAVELLHYAGHGEARPDDPFAARLPLAGGGRLGIADLIALDHAPRWVVLSGCRTGYVDPGAAAGGLTLAHGFLLAGAEGVLGTTATVDDGLAGAVGAAVALHLGPAPDADLARAARGALTGLVDQPGRAAFRVWVP